MHEVGIMQSALDIAEQQAQAAGATKIHEIRLRIGQMSGVVPEALQHAFTVLKDGTMAEEASFALCARGNLNQQDYFVYALTARPRVAMCVGARNWRLFHWRLMNNVLRMRMRPARANENQW